MEVVLLKDVEKVGLRGEVVSVARGYMRNYLQPRNLAEPATAGLVEEIERRDAERALHEARSVEQAQAIAETLSKTVLRFEVKAGTQGVLFGSITPTDIADELWRVRKVRVDRRKIDLDEPIKRVGRYEISIDVFPEVRVDVKTLVVPEGGELPEEELPLGGAEAPDEVLPDGALPDAGGEAVASDRIEPGADEPGADEPRGGRARGGRARVVTVSSPAPPRAGMNGCLIGRPGSAGATSWTLGANLRPALTSWSVTVPTGRCGGIVDAGGISRSQRPKHPERAGDRRPSRMRTCVPIGLHRQSFAFPEQATLELRTGMTLTEQRGWIARTDMAQAVQAAPVPPQSLDAEESVVGAMMLSPGAIAAVSEILDERDFYRESHARMYRAALALYAKGEPVDAITLVDELEERGELEDVGGRARIHELAALVPTTANAGHYARIIREAATLRGLIRAGGEISQLGWEGVGDPTELVDRAEQVVFDLSQQRVSGDFAHIEALLKESFERITALYESGADVTGLPSGFRDLDRLTSGFQPGNLVIVAARPSMGKSAFSLCVAANLAVRHGVPVAVFTLEMSKAEVTQRLMCSEAKVESQRLRSGRLAPEDWPRLTTACDKLAKAPVYVDDTGSVTMMEIRSKARRLKSKQPDLGLIVVDYLQLMTSGTTAENRVQEVSQISRNLKLLARDLDIPILAMSQLSRAVEQRHDKRPILSDLRESGSIEQDADLVAFLYRDDYYNDESDQQGLAEVILAKHRNGPTDTVKLSFLKRYAKFSDLAAL